ncbi:MAG TPA: FtsX-like permease family protein [Terriglobales bacterium]|nr:FtsX-like permease family protein [Terriglobales bacterium]
MTLTRFVTKNAFRSRRRSVLTVLSISFSLLLLTFLMTIWRSFYIDKGTPESAARLMTRHKVSLTFFLPSFYREKIRAVPGVAHVVPMTWFGGRYKDDKPENFFAQFATDPDEYMQVATDKFVPADELAAWQRDRAGCMVDRELAARYGWKLGDRVVIQGVLFPANLELTIRAIYTAVNPNKTLYFHYKYLEELVSYFKGSAGFFFILADSPEAVADVSRGIDEMFRNSPQPTKTETEKHFQLEFIAMLGNVKAFILGIGAAVVFAILLVSANTMAMSIRERTREVAILRTLGFTRQTILSLFVGEAMFLSLLGGVLGVMIGSVLVKAVTKSPMAIGVGTGMRVTPLTMLAALLLAALVGLISAFLPSYRASRMNISEGMRFLG